VAKQLVRDLNTAGVDPVDNIESISWGPDLKNGSRSQVLISENNSSSNQVSKLIVL
jgi:hypothetical protein